MHKVATTLVSAALALLVLQYGNLAGGTGEWVDVTEKNIAYEPGEIHAQVGQVLRIRNMDPFPHKTRISMLRTDGGIERVALAEKNEPKDAVREFHLDQPGHYELRCMLHDGMTATLIVSGD